MKGKKKIPGFLGDLLLLATAVFCVLPFIYMILMSLKSTVNAYDFSFSLSEATLEQYIKIFTKNNFLQYLTNTFRALILPLPTAFGVFIMRQAIIGVPKELIESAKLDGAGDMKILWRVILPLVKSSMMTLAIFTFVGAWNNFIWPLVATTEDSMRTLPLAISTMKTAYDSDVGLTMAGAAVTFLPPFIFYLILQSKFEEGITISGMKG